MILRLPPKNIDDAKDIENIETAISNTHPSLVHLLCTWHINKNILGRCKKLFGTAEKWENFMGVWNIFTSSKTNDEYTTNWKRLESILNTNLELSEYINGVWMKHEQKFVQLWTSRYFHFGNTTTS